MKTIYKNRMIRLCRIVAWNQSNLLKPILLAVSITCFGMAHAKTYYVAANGNNSNPGTLASPFKTWAKLSSVMVAGDIAYIRGGIYTSTAGAGASIHCNFSGLNGTSANWITIQNYPGEYPVLDLTSIGIPTNENPFAVYVQNCSYLRIKGLRVTGLQQHRGGSGISFGWLTVNSPFVIHEQIEVDHIGGYGFKIGNSNDNTYLNCDAHHNDDRWSALPSSDPWGGSDGFGGTGGESSTRTVYDGCRAWWNSDDGWDFYGTDGIRTIKNCWSFWNGYQPGNFLTAGNGEGYKLGPTATNQSTNIIKYLNNCLAFENRGNGFSQNTANSRFQVYNCTAYKNGLRGYWFQWNPGNVFIFKNNIAWDNPNGTMDGHANAQGSYNTWNAGSSVSNADFQSISSAGADGPRQLDGSLPDLNFLKLKAGSNLIDAGLFVGLPYVGNAPDKGHAEFGSQTLPIHNVSLTGNSDNNKHVLNWRIIADEPIKKITIQVSTDASNYVALTSVDPASDKYIYQAFKTGTILYRLQVTSVLDQTVYSNVIALKSTGMNLDIFNVTNVVQSGISINAVYNYLYILSDVSGRILTTGKGNKGLTKLDVRKHSNGMYLLQLISADPATGSINHKETQKILKYQRN